MSTTYAGLTNHELLDLLQKDLAELERNHREMLEVMQKLSRVADDLRRIGSQFARALPLLDVVAD
jgi:hypothetical protein